MQPGIWQILIIAIVVLVLFGRGRISEMMGDFGKGISSFKKGMSEEDRAASGKSDARLEGPAHDAKPAGETVESSDRNGTKSS
ncbi:twin-arginine translocase TatA/TatE family subunit [Aurantiacibacter aquimixticola]|uniref:Sec-independent protein translocase protein TatA n=1 Tax=Aurantiacibacter aquimixticola TaxID=1958945 RepID=A0A419RTD2_9SPHN|nr:twin-arginine translocase TatA/TatE family subunit [Aurantiacibacter aquimixticola]RJY09039.1 twin-arginine translocase TatA/TatE family subunit [Aurantiacibacter aquimixticola]